MRVLSAKENITEDASGILIEGVLESGEKAKEIIARLNGQGIKTKAGSSFKRKNLFRTLTT